METTQIQESSEQLKILEETSRSIVSRTNSQNTGLTSFFIFRSTAEVRFAEILQKAGFIFGVNVRMQLKKKTGEFCFKEADFLVFGANNLVVEIDGVEYHKDRIKDILRDSLFEYNGFIVIRIPAQKLFDLNYVANCIESIKTLCTNNINDIYNR